MRAHPSADIFPMQPEDELQELAEDIREKGLIRAITLTEWTDPAVEDAEPEDVIVDGRNRFRACEIAEIEPRFDRLEDYGLSAAEFIFSVNVKHRFLTQGQQAMAAAMLFPQAIEPAARSPGRGGRQNTSRSTGIPDGVGQSQLSHARKVLRINPLDAPLVMQGVKKLDEAYRAALAKERATTQEALALAELRTDAPDLARLVAEEQLTLDEALAANRSRIEGEKNVRQTIFQMLKTFTDHCERIVNTTRFEELPVWLENENFRREFAVYFPRGSDDFLAKQAVLQGAAEKLLDLMDSLTQQQPMAAED